jgi:hypothetical protein
LAVFHVENGIVGGEEVGTEEPGLVVAPAELRFFLLEAQNTLKFGVFIPRKRWVFL